MDSIRDSAPKRKRWFVGFVVTFWIVAAFVGVAHSPWGEHHKSGLEHLGQFWKCAASPNPAETGYYQATKDGKDEWHSCSKAERLAAQYINKTKDSRWLRDSLRAAPR